MLSLGPVDVLCMNMKCLALAPVLRLRSPATGTIMEGAANIGVWGLSEGRRPVQADPSLALAPPFLFPDCYQMRNLTTGLGSWGHRTVTRKPGPLNQNRYFLP